MNKIVRIIVVIVILAVAGLISVTYAQGQQIAGGTRKGSGRGYFMLGGSLIDLGALNSRLAGIGYARLPNTFISFGGGGYGMRHRLIIGGEGHGFDGLYVAGSAEPEVNISFGYGLFQLGYIVYSRDNLIVYPLIGVGSGAIDLKIVERGIENSSFNALLDSSKPAAALSTRSFLLDAALGVEYTPPFARDGRGGSGFVVGIRVGYILAAANISDWELNGSAVSGVPEVGFSGPYIRLLFGGGGLKKGR